MSRSERHHLKVESMVVEEILIEGIDLGVLMEGTGGEICEREVK